MSFGQSVRDDRVKKLIISFIITILALCSLQLIASQQVGLPAVQQTYYSVVNAGFGNLLFSQHYEEAYSPTLNRSRVTGRYYDAEGLELIDFNTGRMQLEDYDPSGNLGCFSTPLSSPALVGRYIQPAIWLLVQLQQNNVQFTNVGTVNLAERFQAAAYYTTQVAWNSTNKISYLDSFIYNAFALGGISQLTAYNVSLQIDVYFNPNLTLAQGAAIPLRFVLTGVRADTAGAKNINILFDFSLYSFLDPFNLNNNLNFIVTCNSGTPPALTTPTALVSTPNPLPTFEPYGYLALEFSGTNRTGAWAVEVYSNLNYGQDRVDYLQDPSEYEWDSLIYNYDRVDESNFAFKGGAVYTVYDAYIDTFSSTDSCVGAPINASNVNPLQWLNAGSLETLLANISYTAGATYGGRTSFRSLTADYWVLQKATAFNGAIYQYTMNIFVPASGWVHLGRTMDYFSGTQVVRIAISGTAYTSGGSYTYNLLYEIFEQYPASDPYDLFDPAAEGCSIVDTPLPILPPMPPQYHVSVTQQHKEYAYSEEYTQYVDNINNLRRIDGRFSGPRVSSTLTGKYTDKTIVFQEWTQNVTTAAGFSHLTLVNGLPYAVYPSSAPTTTCATASLPGSTLEQLATANVLDLINQTDQATFLYTTSARLTTADLYRATGSFAQSDGTVVSLEFFIYYLSASLTSATIPMSVVWYIISATGGSPVIAYKIEHQFFSFRPTLPPGVFSAPSASSCAANAVYVNTPPSTIYPPPQSTSPSSFPSIGLQFSTLLEGQLYGYQNDANLYTIRWYADYFIGMERFDIEPSYSIPSTAGLFQGSYIYYYSHDKATPWLFNFTSGTVVTYTGTTCSSAPITSSNLSPLLGVAPGTLFNPFFPNNISNPIYESLQYPYDIYFDYWVDEFETSWSGNWGGDTWNLIAEFFVTQKGWTNNPLSNGYSNSRIPVSIQVAGTVLQGGQEYEWTDSWWLQGFQNGAPGLPLYDASILGCSTTPSSPWYGIYSTDDSGNFPTAAPTNPPTSTSSSSSLSTGGIVGIIIAIVVGLLVLGLGVRYCTKKSAGKTAYGQETTTGDGNAAEMAGGMHRLNDEPSLNNRPPLEGLDGRQVRTVSTDQKFSGVDTADEEGDTSGAVNV